MNGNLQPKIDIRMSKLHTCSFGMSDVGKNDEVFETRFRYLNITNKNLSIRHM